MKKLLLLLFAISLSIIGYAQNTSPLIVKDFTVKSNEIIDLEQIPKFNRTDLDSNPICRIKVKSVGFGEDVLQKVLFVPRGIEITHMVFKEGQWLLHVSSRKSGEIIMKYMGDCMFRLPYQLEAGKVYELTLGMETATLVIRTIPTEAEIYIDNQKVGTGEAISAVSIGAEHRYRIVCKDYYTKEDVVVFNQREEKSVNVTLEPNFGFITIKSEPAGADVFVDDVKVGVTPYLTKKITIGTHVVELRKTGCESYSDVVEIKAKEVNKQLENVKLVKDPNYKEQQVVVTPTTPQTQSSHSTPIAQSTQVTPPATSASGNHAFSVSATKKVYFSKGNLQYQASTKTWRFAEHQWDIIGDDNKNISSNYRGWIDLFGWGTGNNPTKSSTSNSDYSSFSDWGNSTISNGGGKSWFTLTKDEWEYVFNTRNISSGIRYAKAIVNGVNGVILLPDNWSISYYNLRKTNKSDASFSSNRISQSDWTSKLEANGAVFLPAAGFRNGTNIYRVGSYCGYWSATYGDSDGACRVFFYEGSLYADDWTTRRSGHGVRLVSLTEN